PVANRPRARAPRLPPKAAKRARRFLRTTRPASLALPPYDARPAAATASRLARGRDDGKDVVLRRRRLGQLACSMRNDADLPQRLGRDGAPRRSCDRSTEHVAALGFVHRDEDRQPRLVRRQKSEEARQALVAISAAHRINLLRRSRLPRDAE